jgi:hypothetical protein
VLVALAVPVGAPWAESLEQPALVAAQPSPTLQVVAGEAPAGPKAAPPAVKPPAEPAAEACRSALLVTVVGWTKEAVAHRSLELISLGLQDGGVQVSILESQLLATPNPDTVLDRVGALAPTVLPLDAVPIDVTPTVAGLQGLASLDATVTLDQVYYRWVRHDATYLVDAGAFVPGWLPVAALEECGEGAPLLDALPLDPFALLDMVDQPGVDGWYTLLAPGIELHVGAAGMSIV